MGREVTLPSRPCTVNGKHYPAEPLTAVYEPHEHEFMRALRERIGQLEPGSDERKALIAEAQTIHEAKALLGARITADGEVVGIEPAPSATEALKVMEGLAVKDERWALGPKARAALAEGQTVLLEPPSHPVRMPYRDDEPDMRDSEPPAWSTTQATMLPPEGATALPLPKPDDNRIGRFNNPETSGAPETQRAAAIETYYTSGSARLQVLEAIQAAGDRGMTDREIETALGMRHQTASARRNDLMNDGWIEDSGKRRETDSGRKAVVWVLSSAGRASWERRVA